jgi:hypothetical protein
VRSRSQCTIDLPLPLHRRGESRGVTLGAPFSRLIKRVVCRLRGRLADYHSDVRFLLSSKSERSTGFASQSWVGNSRKPAEAGPPWITEAPIVSLSFEFAVAYQTQVIGAHAPPDRNHSQLGSRLHAPANSSNSSSLSTPPIRLRHPADRRTGSVVAPAFYVMCGAVAASFLVDPSRELHLPATDAAPVRAPA